MTVSTSTARTEYFASGGTNYNIGFWINSVDHLMVYVADNDGVALTNGVDYNFVVNPTGVGRWTSENADPGTGIDPVNTTVDIYLGNTQVDPLPDGYTVILLRHMPFTQAIKWLNSGGMFPISSENSADFIIQTLQEMEEKISRCPLADPTSDLSGDDFYAELVALSESATASAAAASSSADDAAADAALVQAQIVIAEGYADDALNSATASAASAVQSQDQVALAEAFAIAAGASATDAESAETNAAASAITAGLSETAAGLSEAAAASSASDAEDFKDQAESARDAAIAAGDFFATIGTGGTYETFYDAVQAASASQTSFVFEVVSDIEDSKSSVTFGNGQTVTVYASNYRVRKNMLAPMFIMDPSSSIVWYGGNPQAGLNTFIQVNANASAKFLGSDLSTDTPATDTFAYGQGYIEFDRCYAGSGTGGTVIGHQSLPASVRFTDCTISATNIVSYYTDLAVDGSRVVVERSNLVGGFKELNDVSVDMEMTLVVDINSTVTDTLGTATHLVRLNAAVASGVRYTPTNPADWTDPDPTTVQDALDDLAGVQAGTRVVNRAPTADDDGVDTGGVGFDAFLGMAWMDTSVVPANLWYCYDATTGAALWKRVPPKDGAPTTGFVNPSNITVELNDTSPECVITATTGTIDVVVNGKPMSLISPMVYSFVFPPVSEGAWVFYIDGNGDLTATNNFLYPETFLVDGALVRNGLWDATNSTWIFDGYENHGLMDGVTHKYLHQTRGAAYETGLAPTEFGILDSGTSAAPGSDRQNQFLVTAGSFYDEDIRNVIAQQGVVTPFDPATFPIVYRDGLTWRKHAASPLGAYSSGAGTRASYNAIDAVGSGSQVVVGNDDYVLAHLFATNDPAQPIVARQGTSAYATRNLAEAGALEELKGIFSLGLPMPEWIPLATVMYQTSTGTGWDTYGNVKLVYVNDDDDPFVSWLGATSRGVGLFLGAAASGGTASTDHSTLSNRDSDDQHPISAITGLDDALGEKFDVAGGGIEGDVDIDGYLSVSGGLTTGATGVDTVLAYDCAFLDRTSRPWPILAESQRDSATKALGSVCYNDDTSRLEIWSGSAWLPVAGAGGVTDHDDLTNRDAEDQHPISAITGLDDALDAIDAKEDALGNPSSDGYVLSSSADGVRAWVAGAGGVTDHDDLTNRDAEDSHPISAITGLEDTLDGLEDAIDGKEDALGDPSTDGYVLSSSAAGVRSWVAGGGGGGVTDHDDLANRDIDDQHPISAITGLEDAIDAKEDALGDPSTDGYVLSSSAAGVRSWVAGGGGGDYLPLAGGTMVNGADVIWPASGSDQWIMDPSGGTFAVKHYDETTPATLNVLRLIHHAEGVNYARVSGDVRVDARLISDTAMIGSSVAQQASASLELADEDRAILLNRFASSDPASYVATPAEGMLGYDPVVHRAVLHDGTAWRDVVTAGDLTGKEDYLGVPMPGPTMVLSSTSGGVRSWVGLADTSLWELLTATTDYATAGYTAASYLTITMNADHSPNIKMGMLMRAAIGGTKYPFYVVSCTPAELVLAGNVAPFTGGAISSLSYCTAHNPWITHPLIVPGGWCDTLDTTLLQHDLELIYCWNNEPAYLTAVECATPTLSGTPGFAVTVGGTAYTDEIVPSASSLPTYTGVTSSASTPLTANAASPVRIELDVTTAVATGNSGLYVTLFYAPLKLVEAL